MKRIPTNPTTREALTALRGNVRHNIVFLSIVLILIVVTLNS